MITQKGITKYKINIKRLNLSWFTGMWSQMSMTSNQSMAKAQCILLTDVSYRILREPRKKKILTILILLIKGYKFPLIILT